MSHPEGPRVGGVGVEVRPREGLRLCCTHGQPAAGRAGGRERKYNDLVI